QRRGLHPGGLAQIDHGPGQLAGLVEVLHERPGTDLDVEDEAGGALGDLLRHDRRGDERDAVDGGGDVEQGDELRVRQRQTGTGGADDGPDVLEVAEDLRIAQTRPPTGDGLELVERAPGVAEPAAGQLRDGDVEDRDQRGQGQGDLVPDSPGRMLVRGGPGQ